MAKALCRWGRKTASSSNQEASQNNSAKIIEEQANKIADLEKRLLQKD